jgi:hypothetical protein
VTAGWAPPASASFARLALLASPTAEGLTQVGLRHPPGLRAPDFSSTLRARSGSGIKKGPAGVFPTGPVSSYLRLASCCWA